MRTDPLRALGLLASAALGAVAGCGGGGSSTGVLRWRDATGAIVDGIVATTEIPWVERTLPYLDGDGFAWQLDAATCELWPAQGRPPDEAAQDAAVVRVYESADCSGPEHVFLEARRRGPADRGDAKAAVIVPNVVVAVHGETESLRIRLPYARPAVIDVRSVRGEAGCVAHPAPRVVRAVEVETIELPRGAVCVPPLAPEPGR